MNDPIEVPLIYEWWFPSIIAVAEYSYIENDQLADYILQLQSRSEGRQKSTLGGWQSHDLELRGISHLRDAIVAAYTRYAAEQGAAIQLELGSVWANVNGKGHGHGQHTHNGAILSGVYYVQVPPDSGNLVFTSPHNHILQYGWTGGPFRGNKFLNNECILTPKEGLLAIFPAWLQHYVKRNKSDDDRIAVSFNVNAVKRRVTDESS